jgi:small subunit ribosomal protein S9
VAKKKYYWGTGRRKTSVARVRIAEGSGKLVVNERDFENFFTEEKDRAFILGPLEVTDLRNRVDVFVNVRGGGITGQAGATSQGIARAIKEMYAPGDASAAEGAETEATGFHKKLRDSGYLTRDSRMKERKKYGKKGARKAFQFSKR